MPQDDVVPRWTVAVPFDADARPVVDGRTIVVADGAGIAALDARTGSTRWRFADLTGAAAYGPMLYADRVSSPAMIEGSTLTALDLRSGRERWARPGSGGVLAADESGVVTGHAGGVARFDRDGTRLWSFRDSGGVSRRIAVNDRYVVDLTSHSGARISFDIESLDRRSGEEYGSAGLTDLYGLDARTAYGRPDDFGDDTDVRCGSSDVESVSLGAADSGSPDATRSLLVRSVDYILEDLPVPGPASRGSASPRSPCHDDRNEPPTVAIAGKHVILASGEVLGLFDRVEPKISAPIATPFARFRDATFVGGPYADTFFVARRGRLYAMRIDSRHHVRFIRLETNPSQRFAVAGFGDRVYASAGATTTAFDAKSMRRLAAYRERCTNLRALVRVEKADVLQCGTENGNGLIVSLPR